MPRFNLGGRSTKELDPVDPDSFGHSINRAHLTMNGTVCSSLSLTIAVTLRTDTCAAQAQASATDHRAVPNDAMKPFLWHVFQQQILNCQTSLSRSMMSYA